MFTRINRLVFCAICVSAIFVGRTVADVIMASSSCLLAFNCVGTFEGQLNYPPYQPCNNCVLDATETVNKCKSDTVSCTVITGGLRYCLGSTTELGGDTPCRVAISACKP